MKYEKPELGREVHLVRLGVVHTNGGETQVWFNLFHESFNLIHPKIYKIEKSKKSLGGWTVVLKSRNGKVLKVPWGYFDYYSHG